MVAGSIGAVPHDVDKRTAEFVQHAARWINADVTFNFTAQQALLAEHARCFGISGRDAIIASSRAGYAGTAWGIPYSITIDPNLAMASFDFDVIDRVADKITGRGTDLVHFASATNGSVIKIDTFRHVYDQPNWVKQQTCDNDTRAMP